MVTIRGGKQKACSGELNRSLNDRNTKCWQ